MNLTSSSPTAVTLMDLQRRCSRNHISNCSLGHWRKEESSPLKVVRTVLPLLPSGFLHTANLMSFTFRFPSELANPLFSRRKSVVAPTSNNGTQEILPRSFPDCRICLHHHSNIPVWPNWVHGLLQGRRSRCQRASSQLDPRRGRQAMQILQQRHTSSEFCAT